MAKNEEDSRNSPARTAGASGPSGPKSYDYHRHLRGVAAADVAYVEKKDAQYDASWKKRGGPGAFFTIVRPWDRLASMVERHGYDVFDILEREDIRGPDGTALACVRDLRRYLLLLEAEILERSGASSATEKSTPTATEKSTLTDDEKRHTVSARELVEYYSKLAVSSTRSCFDMYEETARYFGVSREAVKNALFVAAYTRGPKLVSVTEYGLGPELVTVERLESAVAHAINCEGVDSRFCETDHSLAARLTPRIAQHLRGETYVQALDDFRATRGREPNDEETRHYVSLGCWPRDNRAERP